MQALEHALTSLGVKVLDKNEGYRHGIMAAYLPIDQIEAVARLAGVRALTAEPYPEARVGNYTSQGTVVLKTDQVNRQGFRGQGITVGVIGTSFNTAKLNTANPLATTAEEDVKTGDLPPDVKVLQDFDANGHGSNDEGRAMCQIVYDVAPKSKLAFATAAISEVGFANNIVALRTQANCDVIMDDIFYFDEPIFSDGLLAQTVNNVVTSKTLPGKPVIYCSSAGNYGDNGYRSVYRGLSDQTVRANGNHGRLKLGVTDPNSPNYLDPSLTAGGWHNWNPSAGPAEPFTAITVYDDPSLFYNLYLQWDDPFDQDNGITARYNLLVFDTDGNYLQSVSSTTDSFGTQHPFQRVAGLQAGTTYLIAITQTKQTNPTNRGPATHQLAFYTSYLAGDKLNGKYFHASPLDVPTTAGHPGAASAIAVAAYVYDYTGQKDYKPEIEDFTSPGPVTIYFDQSGNRLNTPEVRRKPDVAGPDGTATTFFGFPYQGFPFCFFGTSAAAPHIAGIAALMLEAAGGPKSIDASRVKAILVNTAPKRDIDPLFCGARGASVAVAAQGETYDGPNFFTVNYFGRDSLNRLTIDGTNAGLTFNTRAGPTLGNTRGIRPSDVTFVRGPAKSPTVTLDFTPGKFTSGDSVSFEVDMANPKLDVFSADALGGASFTAKIGGSHPDTVIGSFQNQSGTGYNQADGVGLVDALAAVKSVPQSDMAPQQRLAGTDQ